MTGVQLEVGDTATPFEHRSYGDELANCQRYYFQRNWTATYDSVLSPVWASSTNSFQGTFYMPTTMRAPPTLSHNGAGNFRLNNSVGGDEICNTITIQSSKNNSVVVNFFKATGNLTVTSSGYINTEATNDAYMYFDAEL